MTSKGSLCFSTISSSAPSLPHICLTLFDIVTACGGMYSSLCCLCLVAYQCSVKWIRKDRKVGRLGKEYVKAASQYLHGGFKQRTWKVTIMVCEVNIHHHHYLLTFHRSLFGNNMPLDMEIVIHIIINCKLQLLFQYNYVTCIIVHLQWNIATDCQ
jgi:hypothetical protein